MLHAQNNKTRFFYVLYSDKTWVFDQSECAQFPIYVINSKIMRPKNDNGVISRFVLQQIISKNQSTCEDNFIYLFKMLEKVKAVFVIRVVL